MNTARLFNAMQQANISKSELCKRTGISRSAFYRKCKGTSEFTLSEISDIMRILHLDSAEEIFFNKKVS